MFSSLHVGDRKIIFRSVINSCCFLPIQWYSGYVQFLPVRDLEFHFPNLQIFSNLLFSLIAEERLTFVASRLDINGCVLSYFEGTANVHCYTSFTLTTLHCSKVSFLQCCHMKGYNTIFKKIHKQVQIHTHIITIVNVACSVYFFSGKFYMIHTWLSCCVCVNVTLGFCYC